MKLRLSALALGATMLVGCASSGEQTGRSDPLEGFNRSMYSFNYNVLDPYVVRPVAVAWRDYVPQPALMLFSPNRCLASDNVTSG